MYNIQPKTLFVGKTLKYLPSCHSTNDIALEMIKISPPPEGTIIICSEQTNGKGQFGNTWDTEKGLNLTFSLILYPKLDVNKSFYLNIFTSLAIAHLLEFILPECRISIKWPNDVYVGDRKISGILIQNTIQKNIIHSSIIGIGINVNQTTFQNPKAVSIKNILNKEYNLSEILWVVSEHLEKYYFFLINDEKSLITSYYSKLYFYKVKRFFKSYENIFEGEITGIDEWGRLQIKTADEIRTFGIKEVELFEI